QATATLDSTRFTGGFTLNLDDMSRFSVTGSLNTLDLDSYFPVLVEETEAQSFADQMQTLKESLKGFGGYTGSVNLTAGRMKVMDADVRGAEI
ncbi:hypothetical protein L9G16_19975, partial [Shewanella sp. A25]|nr:hypothetical protein [Shewanella shenzhenensis]